jgi:hypothetical protein
MLRALVDAAHEVTPLSVVLADAEYFDSEHNHRHVHDRLAAVSVIPAKRGKATWQILKVTGPRCGPPSHVSCTEGGLSGRERLLTALKRKLSARAPGRSLEMQRMQALLLGLAYNLYRLRACPV